MKKLPLSLCLFMLMLSIGITLNAQDISAKTNIKLNPKYNQTTIVRDSDGVQYDYATWSKLFYSGAYILRTFKTLKPNGPTEYLLCKPTNAELINYSETLRRPKETSYFKTGQPIKPFNTSDINGKRINLKKLIGKVVVLDFWFINKCTSCQVAIPELNKIVKDYKDKDVVFLAIAIDDINIVNDFLRQVPFDYDIIDSGEAIADKYNIKLYPTHVVIDKEGIVRFHAAGNSFNQFSWIRKTIDEYNK